MILLKVITNQSMTYLSAVNWDAIFSANMTVQGCWDAFYMCYQRYF